MRLQIASDLHLELRPKMTFKEILEPRVAPVLALLGDIAPLGDPNLRSFMEWCSENWDTVIWIPGKLELLGSGFGLEESVAKMRTLVEPFWNITVLDHEGMVSEDGIYIFGLPFWKFPRDEGHVWHPKFFRYVEAEPSPIEPERMRALYNKDLAWIRAKCRAQNEPIVILSHYGPTTWLQEERQRKLAAQRATVEAARKKRQHDSKAMHKKSMRGQPLMKVRMDKILSKLHA